MNKLVVAAGVVAGIGCYTLASAEIRIVTRTTTITRSLTAKGQADEALAARAAPPAAQAPVSTVRTVSRDSDGDRTVTTIKSDGSSVLQQRSRRELDGGKGVEKDSQTLTVKADGTFVDRTVNRTVTW